MATIPAFIENMHKKVKTYHPILGGFCFVRFVLFEFDHYNQENRTTGCLVFLTKP